MFNAPLGLLGPQASLPSEAVGAQRENGLLSQGSDTVPRRALRFNPALLNGSWGGGRGHGESRPSSPHLALGEDPGSAGMLGEPPHQLSRLSGAEVTYRGAGKG